MGPELTGVRIAADQVNADGGIVGRKIELEARYVGFEIPNRFAIGYGLESVALIVLSILALAPVLWLASGVHRLDSAPRTARSRRNPPVA